MQRQRSETDKLVRYCPLLLGPWHDGSHRDGGRKRRAAREIAEPIGVRKGDEDVRITRLSVRDASGRRKRERDRDICRRWSKWRWGSRADCLTMKERVETVPAEQLGLL